MSSKPKAVVAAWPNAGFAVERSAPAYPFEITFTDDSVTHTRERRAPADHLGDAAAKIWT